MTQKTKTAKIGTHFDLDKVYFGIVPTKTKEGLNTFELTVYGLFYQNSDKTYKSFECFGEGSFGFTDKPGDLPMGVFSEVFFVVPFTMFGSKGDIFELRRSNGEWVLAISPEATNLTSCPETKYLSWKEMREMVAEDDF